MRWRGVFVLLLGTAVALERVQDWTDDDDTYNGAWTCDTYDDDAAYTAATCHDNDLSMCDWALTLNWKISAFCGQACNASAGAICLMETLNNLDTSCGMLQGWYEKALATHDALGARSDGFEFDDDALAAAVGSNSSFPWTPFAPNETSAVRRRLEGWPHSYEEELRNGTNYRQYGCDIHVWCRYCDTGANSSCAVIVPHDKDNHHASAAAYAVKRLEDYCLTEGHWGRDWRTGPVAISTTPELAAESTNLSHTYADDVAYASFADDDSWTCDFYDDDTAYDASTCGALGESFCDWAENDISWGVGAFCGDACDEGAAGVCLMEVLANLETSCDTLQEWYVEAQKTNADDTTNAFTTAKLTAVANTTSAEAWSARRLDEWKSYVVNGTNASWHYWGCDHHAWCHYCEGTTCAEIVPQHGGESGGSHHLLSAAIAVEELEKWCIVHGHFGSDWRSSSLVSTARATRDVATPRALPLAVYAGVLIAGAAVRAGWRSYSARARYVEIR